MAGRNSEASSLIGVFDLRYKPRLFRPGKLQSLHRHAAFFTGNAFSVLEDKTRAMIHANGFRFFGDRVQNRSQGDGYGIAYFYGAVFALEIELEGNETRLEDFGERGDENFERQTTVFSAGDIQQRIPLRLIV